MTGNRTIAIGDVHGRDTWRQIVEKEKGANFVFVGDYLDSFNIGVWDQISNFLKIMDFAKRTGAVTLMGNHDFHYTIFGQETYSGFSEITSLHVNSYMDEFHREKRFKTVHLIGDILISHAGVSEAWMRKQEISTVEEINDITHSVPGLLRFAGTSMYGDSPISSPIWIRPKSLLENKVPGYRQIVGHTPHDEITEKDGVWFIDAPQSGQYLAIVDGKIEICML